MNSPNNCASCKHKQHPDGGHCYMFRVEPQEPCMQHTQAPTIYADPKAPHQTLTPEQRAIMEAIPMMQKASPWWASRQPGGGWIATRFNPSAPANTERLPKVGEFKSEKDANAAIAKATKEPQR